VPELEKGGLASVLRRKKALLSADESSAEHEGLARRLKIMWLHPDTVIGLRVGDPPIELCDAHHFVRLGRHDVSSARQPGNLVGHLSPTSASIAAIFIAGDTVHWVHKSSHRT